MLYDAMNEGKDSPWGADDNGLHDHLDDQIVFTNLAAEASPDMLFLGDPDDYISSDYISSPLRDEVVITKKNSKDESFWKYNEGKILREVESYLSSTYNSHYVNSDSKIQTLDLIDSIGDAEAFCRSNAIKYLSRFGKKDGKNRKDILKVIHYAFLLYHFADLPFTEDAKETHSPMGY